MYWHLPQPVTVSSLLFLLWNRKFLLVTCTKKRALAGPSALNITLLNADGVMVPCSALFSGLFSLPLSSVFPSLTQCLFSPKLIYQDLNLALTSLSFSCIPERLQELWGHLL